MSLSLDEFPEYQRLVLETLSQPLEDRVIQISRAKYSITLPCPVMLVAAMNIQNERFKNVPGVHCNAQMSARDLQVFAALDEEASKYISGAIKRLNLSARAYERVLKVYDLVDQLLLHTPEALKLLKFKESHKINLTCNSK